MKKLLTISLFSVAAFAQVTGTFGVGGNGSSGGTITGTVNASGYALSFSCTSSITTILAANHKQGKTPTIKFYDATGIRMEVNAVTLNTTGDVTVTCITPQTVTVIMSSASPASYLNSSFVFPLGASFAIPQDKHGFESTDLEIQIWNNGTPRILILPDTVAVDPSTLVATVTFKRSQAGLATISHR